MFSSLFKYAPVQVFSSLSVFLLIAIQTRYLTVEHYGVLAVFMLAVELIRGMSSQWLNTTLLRLYPAANIEKRQAMTVQVYRLIWCFAFPAFAFLGLFIFAYDLFSVKHWLYASVLLLIKSNYQYFLELARLNETTNRYRLAILTQSVTAVILSAILLYLNPEFHVAMLALSFSYLLGLVFVASKQIFAPYQGSELRTILSYGLPFIFTGGISVFNSRVDRLFIVEGMGLTEAGVYSALSNMLLGITALVFMIVALPLYPDIVKNANNAAVLAKKHQQYSDILLAVTLPSLIGMCFIAEPLISLFLTPDYLSYGIELFWLLATTVFISNFRAHFIDHGLQFTMKTKFLTANALLSLTVNLLLLYVLIPKLGLYGAALSGLIANVVASTSSLMLSSHFGYKHHLGSNFMKILLSVTGMVAVLWLVKLNVSELSNLLSLIIFVSAGIFGYALMIIATNAFQIRALIHKRFL